VQNSSQFGALTAPSNRSAIPRYLIRFVLLLFFFFSFLAGGTAANTDVENLPSTFVGPGQPFAIADFDGDLRPDLADVQTGRSDFSGTDYWIQLQLTTAGHSQSIQVVASTGGLQIVARDVNGDHAVDLVLTTALLRQPVAILLNDGHGGFSRAEPTAFPGAFSESKTNWSSVSNEAMEALGLPPQSRAGIFQEARYLLRGHSPTSSIFFSSAELLANPFLIFHAGRAPPVITQLIDR
jgi:hypothetical protein